jgi:hypothetical protein
MAVNVKGKPSQKEAGESRAPIVGQVCATSCKDRRKERSKKIAPRKRFPAIGRRYARVSVVVLVMGSCF